ncbi:acyltransferase [Candidatus Gracilibacteria bacterium]|nr:acyltransferase [Candidatus Gracilibacteria bacterium]
MQKLNGISGLRGIIALIIVLYHLQQIRPIQGLADWDWALYEFFNMLPVVVAVFFILTGLLRSLGYWGYILHDEKKPDIRKVIIDRWWRIAPAYYVVLTASFVWGIYISGFSLSSLPQLLSGFTFLNWVSPTIFFPTSVNGPLWFIGYDMMGYVFTVAMMIGLAHIQKKYIYSSIIAYICIFLSLHGIWVSLPWIPGDGILSVWFPHYSPFIFALYSIMGIVIGGLITGYRNMTKHIIWDVIFVTSIVSIFSYLWIIRGAPDLAYSYPMSPYRFPIIPGLWAIAIYALIYSRFCGIWIDNRFFTWIAGISYSLYLWHGLIISILLMTIFHQVYTSFTDWSIFSMATIALSLLVAWASVRWIENIRK